MIDKNGLAALDHPAHAAVEGADLNNALDHLNGAALLIDHNGKRRPLDDRGKHRRVDGEMGDAGMLHLE